MAAADLCSPHETFIEAKERPNLKQSCRPCERLQSTCCGCTVLVRGGVELCAPGLEQGPGESAHQPWVCALFCWGAEQACVASVAQVAGPGKPVEHWWLHQTRAARPP